MQHITNLTLIATSDNPHESFTAYLVHPNGGWRIVSHDGETTFRRYRKWLWRKDAKSESVVVPTKAAWDGHGSEEQLTEACERATCGVPRVNQVLHVCGLELVDLSGARW
ncbi:hypothetical protein M409DRAFT_21367 [Zasmidium cellare ATCC 36951]|uniref:Uncharacterized protein n=1 Tax=Zasmidium cellare ATCC 36951 TaxID=1080233 RepID=A0A6A6CNJ8_ZASCE|nr:uncharacterized protein M409DRAFT_21367 [Zasmidium cellare ATCC 36951]KAF2168621.1 hypothetical protein M409DRAFT_21367 [Zasmidium cellare ATCC 36951]